LDVLQAHKNIAKLLSVETSFGGVKNRGVEDAIRSVRRAIASGARYFIKSDIKDFFTKIPRSLVLESIRKFASDIDERFLKLLRSAMETNLENLGDLGTDAELFPLGAEGAAQGSPLSPLMANLLLRDFDIALNGRGIFCVRFIDDFILLGANESHLLRAFANAQRILAQYGMEAYDPLVDTEKATRGETDRGFDFLGCHISRGFVSPSNSSRNKLIESVRETLRDAASELKGIASGTLGNNSRTHALAQTFVELDWRICGWRDAFKFCNSSQALEAQDNKITGLIEEFFQNALTLLQGQPARIRRCILGVGLLAARPRTRKAA
jgi:RNA-directed DNA polymerase